MTPMSGRTIRLCRHRRKKATIPYAVILQKTHLRLLWHRAKAAGFTKEGIWHMLQFVHINPYTMNTADLMRVIPYVNEINSETFNPRPKCAWPEEIALFSAKLR